MLTKRSVIFPVSLPPPPSRMNNATKFQVGDGPCGLCSYAVPAPECCRVLQRLCLVPVEVAVVVESRSNSATTLQLCSPSWGRLMREMCVTQRQLSNDKRIEASAGNWRRAHAQALYSELNQMELPAQLFRHEPNYTGCMRSCSCSWTPSSATLLIKKFVRTARKRWRERERDRVKSQLSAICCQVFGLYSHNPSG